MNNDVCLIEIEAGLLQGIPSVYTVKKMMPAGLVKEILSTSKVMKKMRV